MFVASAAAGLTSVNLKDAEQSSFEYSVGFTQLITVAGLCNNAKFEEDDKDTPVRQRKANGDATDTALLKFNAEFNRINDLDNQYTILADIPFNSKNKWMVKIIRPNHAQTHKEIFGPDYEMDSDIILLKGAPDYLLKKSTHIIEDDGSEKILRTEKTNEIIKIQNDWCILGQRVLLLCKKRCNYDQIMEKSGEMSLEEYIHRSNDFCVVGLCGIIDPPREVSSIMND
jgi:sodium/potassium-transporting ATPase subunit alpha